MAGIYGKGLRAKATKLHSIVVRSRGVCEAAPYSDRPCAGALECAHIVPRRYAATRCDPEAAWSLCKAHHMRLTMHPDEHMELVAETIGLDRFWELKRRAEAGVKTNDAYWQQWIAVLSERDDLTRAGS